ncbi:hypothetical protein LOZ86_11385 [Pectobacterium parvum]|uniref:Uncharacterized protein n=1 Tax=Pectobacterium parvum TaxID=2778550 RepID=A0AAP9IIK4_9GAMM|nr:MULTISPECIES: hypothetical protein [Pectobacterium]GKW43777.1 hypothetical protein PEC301879_36350 [Pectobacterium carotovorum subsp. carotovorum]KHS94843.1 hypothetical protein RC88_11875 [Pectobacterium parvum]QHQ25716.1 hypothetical protein GMX10_17970 [Pectobacterium parvum]UFK37603.1 hypothetical protein LOZ86_11385 [Pectobacterium parvum]UVD95700.1 hypothetical protein NV347_11390 [Pectobacterium parvum]
MGTNSNWSVSNKGNKSVKAISSFDKSDSTSMEIIYQASLNYLDTSGSDNQIAANSTSDVILDTDNSIYDVVFSLPSNGFPVADTSASLPFDPNSDIYPPYSIASGALDAMQNTYKFYQYIQAYPTSNTATKFISAVQAQKNNGMQTQPPTENAIDTFFKGINQFNNCTSVTYASVMSYIKTFAGASVGFNPSYTFYLYQSASDKVVANGQVKFTLNNKNPPFDLTDSNGGYSIVYTDGSGANTNLTYNNGQFVSDINAAFPSVCLAVSWISNNRINNENNSTDSVIPIIAGTVNGNQSCGTKNKKDLSTKSSVSFKTVLGYVTSVFGLMGGADLIYKHTWVKWKERNAEKQKNAEKELTDKQNQDINDKLDKLSEQVAKDEQAVADRLKLDVNTDGDINTASDSVKAASDNLSLQQQKTVLNGEIDEYGSQIEKIAQFDVDKQLESTIVQLKNISNDVNNASTLADIKKVSSNAEPVLNEVNSSINSHINALGDQMSADVKAEINQSNSNIDDLKVQQDGMDERQATEENGESPDDPDMDAGDF